MKKNLVILSGAGISAESGIRTFRDSNDGLWNEFKIEEVCTADAWNSNPTLVNDFYNTIRNNIIDAEPNEAHIALAKAEKDFNVQIITTNVDDLHERAGSTDVLHLHGDILKARTSREAVGSLPDDLVEPFIVLIGREGIQPMQKASDGHLLRPHVVFFQEDVPNIFKAIDTVKWADILIIVGTSLSVYPAASLLESIKKDCKVYYVDPTDNLDSPYSSICQHIKAPATSGIKTVLEQLYN